MILITGSNGMIGRHLSSALLDAGYEVMGLARTDAVLSDPHYHHTVIDLCDLDGLKQVYAHHPITHTIHLAALAHTAGVADLSENAYRQANVENARNVFVAAKDSKILFISTVDVFGFTKGVVNAKTELNPITIYGKTKAEAEVILKKQGGLFNIYRFSPVYTKDIQRDIQKRYYLKYPDLAYIIGNGTKYEVLNVEGAIKAMVDWVESGPMDGTVQIIKDEKLLDTAQMINAEKKSGRAKHVIRIPKWMVKVGFAVLMITGKNKYTYLVNKAVHPLRSE